MVLENVAADMLEGKTKEIEDLEIVTGGEVHSAVSEEGQRGQGELCKKLAGALLSERLLSFVDVSSINKHPGETIVIKKEKIETWIRQYNWDRKQRQG
jgi:Ni,Fe-hydrogenase maturation factor